MKSKNPGNQEETEEERNLFSPFGKDLGKRWSVKETVLTGNDTWDMTVSGTV
jgi:hypothetical protein